VFKFLKFRENRSAVAWGRLSGWDNGPIHTTGVATGQLPAEIADQLAAAFLAAPLEPMTNALTAGYTGNADQGQVDYLNSTNEYRQLTPDLREAMAAFLRTCGPAIGEALGHTWRPCSIRPFTLRPNALAGNVHMDGWPKCIRKCFVLPRGVSAATGATWFKKRDGTVMLFESADPCWVVFENSTIHHALIPGPLGRMTIELDLIPSPKTNLEVASPGLNAWYPWMPDRA
jgi:hypothetical protein